jgi:hypothetical protein
MSFDKLLAELEAAQADNAVLAKSIPAASEEGDKKIAKASEDGDDKENDDEDGEEGEQMTKSMVLDSGDEVLLVDADAMLKSLDALAVKADKHEEIFVKSLGQTLALVKSQGLMIKSLSDQVAKLGGQGAGRKTVLSVNEKQQVTADGLLAKSQPDGLTPQGFLLKSNAAHDAGKITGRELATIDVALRSNQLGVLDESLINRVLS